MLNVRMPRIVVRTTDDMESIGRTLAGQIYPGLLLLADGELGAGKTCLARALGKALGVNNMKSPSFTVEMRHSLPERTFDLIHADLYRRADVREDIAALEEYLDEGMLVVLEWGEKWRNAPLEDRWDVEILFAEEGRLVDLSAWGDRAASALSPVYCEILETLGEKCICP